MLRNTDFTREEEKRKVYVGIMRAKRTLHIHCCGNFLDRFKESATSFETDLQGYPMPQTQILELTHRDVYLDFFKGKKEQILRLRSGMHLEIKGNCLYDEPPRAAVLTGVLSKTEKNDGPWVIPRMTP